MLKKSEKTLQILKLLAINIPVISDWNYNFSKLLVINVPPGCTSELIDNLYIYGSHTLDEHMKKEKLATIIKKTNSAFLFVPYTGTRKNIEIIEMLQTVWITGRLDEQPISALPVIISEEPYVEDLSQKMFFVLLTETFENVKPNITFDYIPNEKDLSLIRDVLERNINSAESREGKAMIAACCFLYPYFESDERNEALANYIECVQELEAMDDGYHDAQDLTTIFVKTFNQWLEEENFQKVFELPEVKSKVLSTIDDSLFFDDEFLYISEKLFKKIVINISDVIPINTFKRGLIEGPLIGSTGNYTRKISVLTEDGKWRRIRLMKFKRSELYEIGDLDVIDQCLRRKERE